MKKILFFIILILLLAHFGFTEPWIDQDVKEYHGSVSILGGMVSTLIWSSVYLLIYTASIGTTLSYLKHYVSLDIEMVRWVLFTWLGGMVINALAYHLLHGHTYVFTAVMALPFILGWAFLINWRNDIPIPDCLKVAGVTALLCAPYFGPTWNF